MSCKKKIQTEKWYIFLKKPVNLINFMMEGRDNYHARKWGPSG